MGLRTCKPEFKPVSAGVHRACLVRLVDLGRNPEYGREKVAMQFEIHALPGAPSLDENGHGRPPRLWALPMTLSMHPQAKLAALLAGWDGLEADDVSEDQDLEDRLGTWGRAQIVHETRKARVYASIARLMPLESRDAVSLPPTYEKPSVYDVRDGRTHGFATLPPWLQAIAMGSDDWNTGKAQREDKTSGSERVGMGGKTPAQALRGAKVPMDNPVQIRRPAATGEIDAMSDDVPF